MTFTRSSKKKYRSHIDNLLMLGALRDYRKDFSPFYILDNSLITATKNMLYDVKLINCNGKYEIWKYNHLKIKSDPGLEPDKVKFKVITKESDLLKFGKESELYDRFYRDFINNPMYRISFRQQFEEQEKKERFEELQKRVSREEEVNKKEPLNKVILKKNIYRSKFSLFRLVKCNYEDFKTFVTLTFADNVTDISYSNDCFRKFVIVISNYFRKKLNLSFKYIVVPEFQKRGAVHYHLLTNIDYDDLELLEEKTIYNKKKGWLEFKFLKKFWNHGFSSVEKIQDNNIVGYLSKFSEYMTKDNDNRLWGRRRYSFSRNLKRPEVVYMNLSNFKDNILFANIVFQCKKTYSNVYSDNFGNAIQYYCYDLINEYDKSFVVGE